MRCAILFLLACSLQGADAWVVDSLVKVFPDDKPAANAWGCLVPRNGHASIQVAVRSATAVPQLSAAVTLGGGLETRVHRVAYVPVGSNPPGTPYDEVLRQAPALFPDPLLDDSPADLAANRTQSFWISIHAPASAAPGEYAAEVRLLAAEKQIGAARFKVRVSKAAVPDQRKLAVTNWLNLDQPFLARYYKLDGDERYWELLGNIGRFMAGHGQTAILTPVFSLAQPVVEGGRIRYDFARLDRWVETFDKAGLRTIEGGHLLGRASEYFSPIVVPAYVIEDGKAVVKQLTPADPRAEAFFASFLPALHDHLRERGWLARYVQHIHDEPHDAEGPIYERFGKLVKKYLPGVPTVDAVGLDQDIRFFEAVADIWVPVLGSFDHRLPLIREHVAKGGQAWFYTCVAPQQRYLNRFIDYPLLKTRLLHWFNFRHDFTGFLHWGGNYWGPRPFDNVQLVINDNRTLLPAGDNAIVYPDPARNSLYGSIRLAQMREGIEDYELLAALAKTDAAKARRLAERAIPHINDYVRDVAEFRRIQAELLGEPAPAASAAPAPPPAAPAARIQAWFVDALTKVFPTDTERAVKPVFHAARRSNLSLQLALRGDAGEIYVDALPLTGPGAPIESASVRWVENVVVTTNTPQTPEQELERAAPALFPDVLRHEFPIGLASGATKAIWVTISVPAGQQPGEYRGAIVVRQGAAPLARVPYTVVVHSATVPERIPLAVTNHFTFSDSLISQHYGVARGTEEWWRLVRNFARFAARYHQSSVVASPVGMAAVTLENGRLKYDFANFERFVSAFRDAGVDGQIEGGDLLFRQRVRGAPIMLRAWIEEDGKPVLRSLPYADPRAQQFLADFLPQLRALLDRRGWTKSYLQGVLDEPHEGEYEAFAETAAKVRKLLPGIRTIEPVGAKQDLGFMRDIDTLVIQLGTFDENRLAELRKLGADLWFYTALTPRGQHPNRFIDYSLTKVRILHWMNYRYGFRGWLHWGGNYWGPEPWRDTQPVINGGRTYLPPGDAYITYPDRGRMSLYSTIRLEQMREGIEDFALLDELAKRDRARADAIAAEAVRSFTDYVRDPAQFRAVHLKLLEALSR